jgi:hypothetical protein
MKSLKGIVVIDLVSIVSDPGYNFGSVKLFDRFALKL